MIEVECPSCKASYQVDERRVPAAGLKMRCPKCGESFQVSHPTASEEPILGAALGLGKEEWGGATKKTMLGVPAPSQALPPPRPAVAPPRPAGPPPRPAGPPPRPSQQKQTMLGVAPAQSASLGDTRADELELESFEEEELPSEGGEWEAALPQARSPGTWQDSVVPAWQPDDSELSLPALAVEQPAPPEIDLPAMPGSTEEGLETEDEWGDAALPDLTPAPDLPSPRVPPVTQGETFSLEEWGDLPDLSASPPAVQVPSFAEEDLELPDLGSPSSGLPKDLPLKGAELPSLGGELPSLSAALPENPSADFPDLSAELPLVGDLLPDQAAAAPSPWAQLPQPQTSAAATEERWSEPPPRASHWPPAPGSVAPSQRPPSGDPSSFGEVDFGEADDAAEFDAFPTEGSDPPREEARSGYGEVHLDGGVGALALDEDAEVARPSPSAASPAAVSAPVERPSSSAEIFVPPSRRGMSRKLKWGAGLVLLFTVAGGALALVPDVGPFGAYFIYDTVRASHNREKLAEDVRRAEQHLQTDSAPEWEAAFQLVDRGRAEAPRYRARQAFAAYLGLARQIRFGEDSPIVAQARVLLRELTEKPLDDVEYGELAQWASRVAEGKAADVVAQGPRLLTRSVHFAALVGEAALLQNELSLAEQAFQRVASEAPAWGQFGLARTYYSEHKLEAVQEALQKTIESSPQHVGARLLQIELEKSDSSKEEELVKRLSALLEAPAQLSQREQARGWTLLGEIHLSRSRLKQAETAFLQALQLAASEARAQRGLAQVLLDSGRAGEALARFEAAVRSQPADRLAQLGIVRAQLQLGSLEDASRRLEALQAEHAKSTSVAYWNGRVKEAIGARPAAQSAYEQAMEWGEDVPELVLSHIALTRLLSQEGKWEEADAIIARAKERFPRDPEVYRALGELAVGRGNYEEAIAHYDRALELDSKNIGLRFGRAVALRGARQFDAAWEELSAVEAGEKEFPGLALERGNLYEASGRTEEALRAYESALAEAPEDPELMLRVGCGRALAGQVEQATALLQKVLDVRSSSAEAYFCQGVAYLKEGKNLPEARRFLERAVGLDALRPQYHLYVGRVALEMHDYALALRYFNQALELDRSLADAYWQRGLLKVRQGAVRDAEVDLRQALALNPGRLEAHAALAEAYMQTGKEQLALAEWRAALSGGQSEAVWHYRYGKLLFDNRQLAEAQRELQLALQKATEAQAGIEGATPPAWVGEAHRHLALALGRTKEAVPHWEAYIQQAERNSPYLVEALRELRAIAPE